MGTLVQKWGPNGDQKTEKGPHGDRVPQMGTHLGAVPLKTGTRPLQIFDQMYGIRCGASAQIIVFNVDHNASREDQVCRQQDWFDIVHLQKFRSI